MSAAFSLSIAFNSPRLSLYQRYKVSFDAFAALEGVPQLVDDVVDLQELVVYCHCMMACVRAEAEAVANVEQLGDVLPSEL